MNRLDFNCDHWMDGENAPPKSITRLLMPDFQEKDKPCIHLRGRGWRWVTLKCTYPKLVEDEDYELYFWAEFDFYAENGSRCFIELCDSDDWDKHHHYDITPNSPYVMACSVDWVLYRYCFKTLGKKELYAQIIAFEANIAIMQANPEDEMQPYVAAIQHKDEQLPFAVDEELPFKEFDSLEQRIVRYHYDLLAPYYPCKDIFEVSQREYYDFVNEIYDKLFTAPEGFFSKIYEDDAHPNRFNNASYGKPELKRHMKSDYEKITELFNLLKDIGITGSVTEDGIHSNNEISSKQKKQLLYMGFEVTNDFIIHKKYKNMGNAIKYLAGKERALCSLMYCWFYESYSYLENTFAKHYDTEQYNRLTGWLRQNGYLRNVGSGTGSVLDYYKSINKKETPVGYAIHGDKFHYGFTFEFRYEPRVMFHCEPRIIKYVEMLKKYDELSENTKKLILQRTKRCDACRYCVQTDKTGKRLFAAIKIMEGSVLCPYYPGFYFVFERLTRKDVDYIISFLIDMEKVLTQLN